MAHGENVFWHGAIHVGIGLLPLGLHVKKMDANIGFGLGAMHKVVLGLARMIRQLENRAHSHSGRVKPKYSMDLVSLVITVEDMYRGI
jgi:hypothetical protein